MEKKVMKVFQSSKISKAGQFEIPENLKLEARMIIYSQSPVVSVARATASEEGTTVSVEGTVTEIGSIKKVKLKKKRRKTDKRELELRDDSGSIRIVFWGEDVKQLGGASVGDSVHVINVKTDCYFDTVSLNSTDYTRVVKNRSAEVQNVTLEIFGIVRVGATRTELEAQVGDDVKTFDVATSLLAKAFGVGPKDDLEERLLEKIPLSTEAVIKGDKIQKIAAKKEM
ncbi:uncharacterized protein [Embiotoca jacksoni]|uniref:uncharacterized protein n=1 Tax=Embiotoca jacksoni TaxID=100190 RepID=UPI003704A359